MYKSLCVLVVALSLPEIGKSSADDFQPVCWNCDNIIGKAAGLDSDLERVKSTLTEEIKQVLNDTGIPSISICLLQNDKVVWTQAFGCSHVKLQVPASSKTIYSTGSCFK